MADKKVKFVLDLDVKEFTEKGLEAKGIIEKIGHEDNMTGLIEGLVKTSAVLGTVGLAAYSFKKAIDLTMEAEKIRQVEKQFGALANAAGISAKELQGGMEKASKGLITTGDLLEIANKNIVTMGSSAKRLPEIMEVARKSTAVFGGDLKSNFENISQAIANGNAKMLKQYGIVIDTEAAVKKYAAANNVAANELSEMGKRQAILNAAIEQGQKNFKDVDLDLNQATNTMTLLKNTVSETMELFTLAFEKTMGPTVRKFLVTVKDYAESARVSLTAMFGEGLAQNEAQVAQMETRLSGLNHQLKELQKGNEEPGFFSKLFKGSRDDQITNLTKEIEQTTASLDQLRMKNNELEAEDELANGKKTSRTQQGLQEEMLNKEARAQNEIDYQTRLIKIRSEGLEAFQRNVQSVSEIEEALRQRSLLGEQNHALRVAEIKAKATLTEKTRTSLLQAEERRYANEKISLEQSVSTTREKLLKQYVSNSQNAFQAIGRAIQAGSMQAAQDMGDFGKRGQQVFQSIQTHSTFAFQQMGQAIVEGKNVAESAAMAIGNIFLNVIADRAIAEGSMLLLSGLWPPNPASLAAGAGLIALGGAIRTITGGSAGRVAGATGGGPGVSGGYGVACEPKAVVTKPEQEFEAKTATAVSEAVKEDRQEARDSAMTSNAAMTAEIRPDVEQNAKKQRAVNINIAGNYMDTDSTRRQLIELIRQETDATDFRYDRIGVGA